MSMILKYMAVSDVGCVRKNNEDMAFAAGQLVRDGSCEGEEPGGQGVVAFAVADGMGGYEGGEVASEIVARAFSAFVKDLAEGKAHCDISTLKRWAAEANRLVLDTAALRPGLAEMGTTLVALLFDGDRCWLVNIGDSRCYRLRSGVLKQLSTDHSERQRTGDPSVPSNLIYNFMGNYPDEFFSDITELKPLPGDVYLLCSDGVSDMLDDDQIEANANEPQKLIDLAKSAGGHDNATLVAITCQAD